MRQRQVRPRTSSSAFRHAILAESPPLTRQVRLEAQGGEDFAGAEPPVPLARPSRIGGRRNIGCGWWPIGSDADRDCAAGGHRF